MKEPDDLKRAEDSSEVEAPHVQPDLKANATVGKLRPGAAPRAIKDRGLPTNQQG